MKPNVRTLALVTLALTALAVQGCGKGSEPDEAALHKQLAGPPSLAGMAKHPKAAHGPATGAPAAGGAATAGQ